MSCKASGNTHGTERHDLGRGGAGEKHIGPYSGTFEPLLEQPTQPGIHHGKGEPGEIFQTDVLCGPSLDGLYLLRAVVLLKQSFRNAKVNRVLQELVLNQIGVVLL